MMERDVLDRFLEPRTEEARALLFEAATLREVAAGECVLARGELPDRLLLIGSGLLRVELLDRHGAPLEVARLGPADLLGELSFLTGEPASADVIAETDGQVWVIDHTTLATAAELDETLTRDLAVLVATRVTSTNERLRRAHLGRVATIVCDPHPTKIGALHRIALAAARQNRAPVLLVDLGGGASPAYPDVERFAGLGGLPGNRSVLRDLEGFAGAGGPHIAYLPSEADPAPVEGLAVLLQQMRRRFSTVIVRSDPGDPRRDALERESNVVLTLLREGERAPASMTAVLLSESPAEPWQRDIAKASRAADCKVSAVIPGPTTSLTLERAAHPLPAVTQAEVNRAARIVIGRTVGLALGAGGAKGYAHIGAARALRDLGVPIDFVAGCSVAAPLAGAIAADYSFEVMQDSMDRLLNEAAKLTLPIRSLLSNRGLDSGLRELTREQTFEDARIPLAIIATDLEHREVVTFTRGEVHAPMLASAAIPILFPPVVIDGVALVDGGVLEPIPIRQVARMGADIVIAVKLNDPVRVERRRRGRLGIGRPPVVDAVLDTISAMQWQIFSESDAQADISIEPKFEGPTGLRDWSRGPYFTECGARAVEAARDQIEQHLPWVRPS